MQKSRMVMFRTATKGTLKIRTLHIVHKPSPSWCNAGWKALDGACTAMATVLHFMLCGNATFGASTL